MFEDMFLVKIASKGTSLIISQSGDLVWKQDFMFVMSYCISANTSDTFSLIGPTATRRCDFLDIIVHIVYKSLSERLLAAMSIPLKYIWCSGDYSSSSLSLEWS